MFEDTSKKVKDVCLVGVSLASAWLGLRACLGSSGEGYHISGGVGEAYRLSEYPLAAESFCVAISGEGRYVTHPISFGFFASNPKVYQSFEEQFANYEFSPPLVKPVDDELNPEFYQSYGSGGLLQIDDRVIFVSSEHVMAMAGQEFEKGVFFQKANDFAACDPEVVGIDLQQFSHVTLKLSSLTDRELIDRTVRFLGIGANGGYELVAPINDEWQARIDGMPGVFSPRLLCAVNGVEPAMLGGISGAPVIDDDTGEMVGIFTGGWANQIPVVRGDSVVNVTVIEIIGPDLLRECVADYIKSPFFTLSGSSDSTSPLGENGSAQPR